MIKPNGVNTNLGNYTATRAVLSTITSCDWVIGHPCLYAPTVSYVILPYPGLVLRPASRIPLVILKQLVGPEKEATLVYLYLFSLLALMLIRVCTCTHVIVHVHPCSSVHVYIHVHVGLCLRQGCCNSGRSPDPHPDGAGGRGHQSPTLLRGDGQNRRRLGDGRGDLQP